MELKDFKEPIEIIKLIQTLLTESIDEAIRTEDKKATNLDIFEMWEGTVGKVYRLVDSKLILLDIALISLKIEDEEKYYKLKDIVCRLDDEIEDYYQNQEEYSPYPTPPPKIIKNHVKDMQVFQSGSKSANSNSNDFKNDVLIGSKEELELNKKDRIKLLSQLGILKFLMDTYPKCKNNESEVARLICRISPDFKQITIQKYINELMTSGLDVTKDNDLEIISFVNSLKN
jgi:hypothetical protein